MFFSISVAQGHRLSGRIVFFLVRGPGLYGQLFSSATHFELNGKSDSE